MDDLRLRVSGVLARDNDWMTVAEVQNALTSSASKLRIRIALDSLVEEERAVCRTKPKRQYRSQRVGGAKAKAPKRSFLSVLNPSPCLSNTTTG